MVFNFSRSLVKDYEVLGMDAVGLGGRSGRHRRMGRLLLDLLLGHGGVVPDEGRDLSCIPIQAEGLDGAARRTEVVFVQDADNASPTPRSGACGSVFVLSGESVGF